MKWLFFISITWLLSSCVGTSVLKASRDSEADEFLVMGKKRYKLYVVGKGRNNKETGRYRTSGDTLFLSGKKKDDDSPPVAYALPDLVTKKLLYIRRDSNDTSSFTLHYYNPDR